LSLHANQLGQQYGKVEFIVRPKETVARLHSTAQAAKGHQIDHTYSLKTDSSEPFVRNAAQLPNGSFSEIRKSPIEFRGQIYRRI